jgi:CRISPR system Cascade subunit CasA
MNTGLLGNSGEVWVGRIISELAITNQHVQQVGELAIRISKASGGYNDDVKNIAKEQAYFRLNSKFQVWLENIDPENDELDETCELWFEQSQKVVRGLGRELIEQAGPQAFVGREIKEKIEGKEVERRYTLPAAYNYFLARTANRESIGGGKNYE